MRFLLFSLGALCVSFAAAAPARAFELTVHAGPVARGGGTVYCALFQAAEGFPGGKAAAQIQSAPAEAPRTDCVFSNIEAGNYAVSVFHDADGNGALNTSFLGIPSEDWGTSNNVRPNFRAPRFEESRFQLQQDMAISVELMQ